MFSSTLISVKPERRLCNLLLTVHTQAASEICQLWEKNLKEKKAHGCLQHYHVPPAGEEPNTLLHKDRQVCSQKHTSHRVTCVDVPVSAAHSLIQGHETTKN